MSYATLSQLLDRYGAQMLVNLTDRGEVATGEVDGAVVDRSLADADAMIDGYLAGRYALPLSQIPPLVVDLAQVIAIWKLHRYQPDPKIEADYKDARKTLEAISRGDVRLPVEGADPAGTGGTGARITDRDRPFTEANLKGFI